MIVWRVQWDKESAGVPLAFICKWSNDSREGRVQWEKESATRAKAPSRRGRGAPGEMRFQGWAGVMAG